MLAEKIRTALKTAEYKGKRYGHSYMIHGEIMKSLFPNGLNLSDTVTNGQTSTKTQYMT